MNEKFVNRWEEGVSELTIEVKINEKYRSPGCGGITVAQTYLANSNIGILTIIIRAIFFCLFVLLF